MAAVATGPTEIDRKLHRAVLEAAPGRYASLIALARAIETGRFQEFSYRRDEQYQFANAETIRFYIAFAREIGLLNEDLGATRPKSQIRTLDGFQQWLSDRVAQYLINRGASPTQITGAVRNLLNATPAELPSQDRVRRRLTNPPAPADFRACLKILALFRPNVLGLASRRVVLIPGVFEG